MAINKVFKKVMEVISHTDIDITKNYKLIRSAIEVINTNPLMKTTSKDEIIMTNNRMIPIRLFIPKGNNTKEVIIFYHGGGFVTGSINSYNKVCQNIANYTNNLVISVEYRLAPEFPFPIGLNDCYQATKELYRMLKESKVRNRNITLMGDSAGGNLAAVISLMSRNTGDFKVQNQILLYPLVDTNHGSDSPYPSVYENGKDFVLTRKRIEDYLKLYLTSPKDINNIYAAPIKATLEQQPRTLIITAEFDPLRDEGYAYYQKLKQYKNKAYYHEVKDCIHGFIGSSLYPKQVKEALYIMNDFLRRK